MIYFHISRRFRLLSRLLLLEICDKKIDDHTVAFGSLGSLNREIGIVYGFGYR